LFLHGLLKYGENKSTFFFHPILKISNFDPAYLISMQTPNITKFILSLSIILLFFIILVFDASCKSGKAVCQSNRSYKPAKVKKNRSNYGVLYEFKSKPVKKDYVIRNVR